MDDCVRNYYYHAQVFLLIVVALSAIAYTAWIDFGARFGIQIVLCFIGLLDMFFVFLFIRCFMALKRYRSSHLK